MKKAYLLVLVTIFNVALFSCAPETLQESDLVTTSSETDLQDCCSDEEQDILPPPRRSK